MEPNCEALQVSEIDRRTLFAAKLAAREDERSATENIPFKKRGAFLAKRFFGIKKTTEDRQREEIHEIAEITAESRSAENTGRDQHLEGHTIRNAGESLEPSAMPDVGFTDPVVVPPDPFVVNADPIVVNPDPLTAPALRDESTSGSPTAGRAEPFAADVSADAAGDSHGAEIQGPEMHALEIQGQDSHAPEIHVASMPGDRPIPAATDLPQPRMSVPSFDRQHMRPNGTVNRSRSIGRACAQLTFAFEVTSLQLTPFFRLGSVQLKALSNVVSLGLVSGQGVDEPFAAAISFQIESVDLDDAGHLKSVLLRPLGELREIAAPLPELHVESVAIASDPHEAPISVTTSAGSTTVQLIGVFAIAALEFTPTLAIDTLRLEPVSNTVRLRVAASGPGARDPLSSFEIAELQLDDAAQIRSARLTPSAPGNA